MGYCSLVALENTKKEYKIKFHLSFPLPKQVLWKQKYNLTSLLTSLRNIKKNSEKKLPQIFMTWNKHRFFFGGGWKESFLVTTLKLWETKDKVGLISDVMSQEKCSNHVHLRKKKQNKNYMFLTWGWYMDWLRLY